MASGGTIFLDEVAEMPTDIQVKLLRALESRQVRRLGGKREINVDIRIVAATNKDLQKALAEGELREDLYYRLAVVELYLPPLRERVGDIRLLAEEFLARFSSQNGKKLQGFDDEAMDWILSFSWPGNVRELKNAVERAVIMSRGPRIGTADIVPRHLRQSGEMPTVVSVNVGSTVADARRQLALRTFASMGGDLERAAKTLGVSRDELRADLLSVIGGSPSANGGAASAAGGSHGSANGAPGEDEEEQVEEREAEPAQTRSRTAKPAPAKGKVVKKHR
jgi:DNA-binding NtrC family response regulator